MKYHLYLKSAQWSNLRDLVLGLLVDGKCSRCQNYEATECHHTHYRTLGKENPYDGTVIGICRGCHEFLHNRSQVDPSYYKTWIDLYQAKLKEL